MMQETTEIKEETFLCEIKAKEQQQKEIDFLLTGEQQELNVKPPVASDTPVEVNHTSEEQGKEKDACKEMNVLEAEVITPLAVVNHHDVQQFEVEDVNSDDDDDVDEEAEDSLNEKNDENDLQLRLQLDYAKSDLNDSTEYLAFAGTPITKGGFNRVNHPGGAFLSDDLVALRIALFLHNLDPQKRERVHSFDPSFYRDRLRDLNQDLSHWVKNIDTLSLDFLFIPISMESHYSLCVVVRPLEWMKDLYLVNDPHNENDLKQYACILFLDSIGGKFSDRGYHDCQTIGLNIRHFLSCLWKYEVEKDSKLSAKPSTAQRNSRYTHMQISEYINRIICTEDYLTDVGNGKCFFRDVPILYCPTAPKQSNGFDCGYFTFKFLELIVDLFPSSLACDLSLSFSNWIQEEQITQDEIANEKLLFKSMLENLHDEFEANKRNPEMVASTDHSFCVYQRTNSVHTASSNTPVTSKNETTDVVLDDFNHRVVIEGCVEKTIGDLQIFADATIYYPNNKELQCNAGTVMCGTNKPLLLIMFAISPNVFCTREIKDLDVNDVQVISLNLDEYRSEVEKLLLLTSLEDRVLSIFDNQNGFKLVSEAWANVHENHLCYENQQQWWCGNMEGLSDIANGLLSYYCKSKEDTIISSIKPHTSIISSMKVLSCTAWTNDDDNNQKLCKLDITFGIVQSKVTASIIRKTVVEPPKTSLKPTDVEKLDAFKDFALNTPEPVNVIPTLSPPSKATLDSKGVANSSTSNNSILPRSSNRVKKLRDFLSSSSDPTSNLRSQGKKANKTDENANDAIIQPAKRLYSKRVNKQHTLGNNKRLKKVVSNDSESFSESFNDYEQLHNYGADSSFMAPLPLLDTSITDAPKRRSTRASHYSIAADTSIIVDVAADNSAKAAQLASKAENARLLSVIADYDAKLRRKEEEQKAENAIAASKISASLACTESMRQENEAKELKIREALEESNHMKAQFMILQKQKEDLDRKIFETELNAKWKIDFAALQEANKILLTKIQYMENGRVELETSNEKTKEEALKIFKSGLDYQEKSNSKISEVVQDHNKQTTNIVKSILENAASTQSQLLLSTSSQSQLLHLNNLSASMEPSQKIVYSRDDKKKKKDKKKKRSKTKKLEIIKQSLKLDAAYEVEKMRLKDLKAKRREQKQTVPSLSSSSSSSSSSDSDSNE